MEREIDLKEITDGKFYTANYMVKIGCNDCKGCSECCRVVEDTIILDPYDIVCGISDGNFWTNKSTSCRSNLCIGFEKVISVCCPIFVINYIWNFRLLDFYPSVFFLI